MIAPRTRDIAYLVFEIAPYYANDSAYAFVKRNLPAKSLALQLEVAAVREDGRTDIRAITSDSVTICSRIVTESIHIPSRSLIIIDTPDIEA